MCAVEFTHNGDFLFEIIHIVQCSSVCLFTLCFLFVDYFRSVSKALEEIQIKEIRMVEELQKDREQENKLKDEIEVCFSYSLSLLTEMDACMLNSHIKVTKQE